MTNLAVAEKQRVVTTASLPKQVVKWLWFLYPTSNASMKSVNLASTSKVLARSMRQRGARLLVVRMTDRSMIEIRPSGQRFMCRKGDVAEDDAPAMFSCMYSMARSVLSETTATRGPRRKDCRHVVAIRYRVEHRSPTEWRYVRASLTRLMTAQFPAAPPQRRPDA